MFVKVYPEQLKDHWPMICDAYIASVPDPKEASLSLLALNLLSLKAVCWFVLEEDSIAAVFITQVSDDPARGGKTITILAAHAIGVTNETMFLTGYKTMQEYAKSLNITKFDFFTSNEKIKQYARMFENRIEQTYFQLILEV